MRLAQKYIAVVCSILAGIFSGGSLAAQDGSDTVLVVENISIIGNETTVPHVILREMSLHVGDTLTQTSLRHNVQHDRDQIYNLGLFNKVDVTYRRDSIDAEVLVAVSERWYFFPYPILGARYHDITKLYYGAGVLHQNFRGRNEKLYGNFGFGYDQWVSVNYQNPKITDDDDIFFGANLSLYKLHNLDTANGAYSNNNSSLLTTIGKRFGFYQTAYVYAGYNIWQVSEMQTGRTVSATGRDAFFSASLQYWYDTRNNHEYTTDGTLVKWILTKYGFGESEVNLTQINLDIRKFFGWGNENGIGFRLYGDDITGGNVPAYLHSFFGYNDRIRGYFTRVIEAEGKALASVEMRLPIITPRYFVADFIGIPQFQQLKYGLYFGIFADAGKAWYRNQIVADLPWYSGYGAGLQFLFPYGFVVRTEGAINNLGKTELIFDLDTSF
ncbi:MAG TPA: BamA/TamA family outer membrane protein [Bacteroidota bacterium]|nr:BamA/TamA family outer membrane protein [Bacteroidota bacterium]